jgi:hypothetical protein
VLLVLMVLLLLMLMLVVVGDLSSSFCSGSLS